VHRRVRDTESTGRRSGAARPVSVSAAGAGPAPPLADRRATAAG